VNRVVPGQLWSLLDSLRPRYTIRVTRIVGLRVYGTLAGGKKVNVHLSVLRHGRRGSRLVEHPDGSPAEPCGRQQRDSVKPRLSVEDTRSASDYVKTTEPRGVTHTNDLQREALALREAGVSIGDLCVKYGKSYGVVSAWLSRAREAREDGRSVAACRKTG